ncbi:hypothetical protein I552_6939 [Mycobacterium xenopi 3993]|nr:hypothetical protein I552_6939 [Mycobacterium xenopi 3993]
MPPPSPDPTSAKRATGPVTATPKLRPSRFSSRETARRIGTSTADRWPGNHRLAATMSHHHYTALHLAASGIQQTHCCAGWARI